MNHRIATKGKVNYPRLTAGSSAIELRRSNGTDGKNRRDLTRLAEAEKYCQSAFRHPKPAAGCSAIGPTEERNGTDIENRCDLTRLAKAGKQFVNERFGNQNRLFLFLSYAVLPSRSLSLITHVRTQQIG